MEEQALASSTCPIQFPVHKLPSTLTGTKKSHVENTSTTYVFVDVHPFQGFLVYNYPQTIDICLVCLLLVMSTSQAMSPL